MKIIHTSDWHLGQNFFTKNRKEEHQEFLAWLLEQVEQQKVDAILIAGDVFDTATPPSYAREMYHRFIVDLHRLNCRLIVLGGNHDSVAVLNETKPLIEKLGSYVVASTSLPLEEQLIPLKNKQGEIAALVGAVPFIRPRDVLFSQAGETSEQKNTKLDEVIQQHYHQLYQLAVDYKQQHQLAVPIIMTGHLAALGVSLSESVREIYIGSLQGYSANNFPPADYIALGHIHRPQRVSKQENIRYSGSPIPLSFDELGTKKQLILLEFTQDKLTTINHLDIPQFQPMAVFSGRLAEIEQQLKKLAPKVANTDEKPLWLQLQVEESDYISDLQQQIQTLITGLNVELVRLQRIKKGERSTLSYQHKETLEELSPQQVFIQRLQQASLLNDKGEADIAQTERLVKLYSDILEELAD